MRNVTFKVGKLAELSYDPDWQQLKDDFILAPSQMVQKRGAAQSAADRANCLVF
jgi:hypothetical protein